MRRSRREFLRLTAAGAAAATMGTGVQGQEKPDGKESPAQTVLPRWRGFNPRLFNFSKSNKK